MNVLYYKLHVVNFPQLSNWCPLRIMFWHISDETGLLNHIRIFKQEERRIKCPLKYETMSVLGVDTLDMEGNVCQSVGGHGGWQGESFLLIMVGYATIESAFPGIM